mgnify:CR=1 FL=1
MLFLNKMFCKAASFLTNELDKLLGSLQVQLRGIINEIAEHNGEFNGPQGRESNEQEVRALHHLEVYASH